MYEVIFGNLVKEDDYWNVDGMAGAECETFETLEDAKASYDLYDVEDRFRTEWETAAVKPKKKGFYAEISTVDEDEDMIESIEFKQFTADDMQ